MSKEKIVKTNAMRILDLKKINYEIISYKLKQRIDQLRKEQKQLENEGKIEESIKLAIELASITKKLKEAKRV